MPILKKTLNADTARKIIRMQKNVAIPGYDYCYPKLYLQLNNMYIGNLVTVQDTALWTHRPGDTVLIKADINGYGPIYGSLTSGFYIATDTGDSGRDLIWVVGGNEVARVPSVTDESHIIGWVGVTEGGVNKCQPYFDGAVVSGSSAYTFSETSVVLLGGAYSGSSGGQYCIANDGGAWAIRIYEVVADMKSTGAWHLYACEYSDGHSAARYGMFEAENRKNTSYRFREAIAGGAVSGATPSSSVGNFPTEGYGVQLFDLKSITGSKYNDLLAIMADDGGIDTLTGWDSTTAATPYYLTRNSDSAQLPFAFWLGSASQSGRRPIPSGYSYPSSGNNEIGLLQMGRRPKWTIWQDNIDWGFYVFEDASITPRRYYLQFNLFKRISTTYGDTYHTVDIPAKLENFENYDSTDVEQHAPKITYSSTDLQCHVHNGALAKCLEGDLFVGYNQRWKDNFCIYRLNNTVGGSATWRVGNLLPWNFTDTELDNYGYSVRAAKFSIKYRVGGLDYFTDEIHDTNYARLCKNTLTSNPTLAGTLRRWGKQLDLRIVDENKFSFLIDLTNASGHTMAMVGSMQLLMGDNHNIELNVDRLFHNSATFNVSALFDSKENQNSTNYRMIFDESLLATDTTPMVTVDSSYSTDLHPGVIGAYKGMADLGVHTLFNYTNPFTSKSFSCIILPIMRFSWYNYGQHHDPCPIIEPNSYWPGTAGGGTQEATARKRYATTGIQYRAFVEVYTQETEDSNPVYGHYIALVQAMDGMGQFKKYCDYGSPTANSRLSGWQADAGQELMQQAWNFQDPMLENTTLSDYSSMGEPCWLDTIEAASPWGDFSTSSKSPYQASASSVKMFVVPKNLLGKVGGELNENTTAIFHMLNINSPVVFASYDGRIRPDTYQKYDSVTRFFKQGTTQPARSCYFVFTHPYYKYTISGGTITGGIQFLFRTYVKDATATNGYKYIENIVDNLDTGATGYNGTMYIKLYCYNGDVDYASLASSTVIKPYLGHYVAKFEIKKSDSPSQRWDRWGNYTLEYADDAASDTDFYNWGNEPAGTETFQSFTLTRTVGSYSSYVPSVLYEIEINGEKPDGWDTDTPTDIDS